MKQGLMCINSDAINRYNMMITTGALEKSLKETYDRGTPMLIGHDFHKPIGWNVPFGLYIEPGLTRLLAKKMMATDSEDMKIVGRALNNYLDKVYSRDFQPFEKEFMALIKDHITAAHTRIKAGCVAVIESGLTGKIFPALFSNNDKDGLVPLSFLLKHFTYLGQGIFKSNSKPLAVYAHPYFRRSQSRFNNFHFHFLDELMSLKDNQDIEIKISLDEDMIGFAPSYHEAGELEFHFGPKYTDDIKDIKPGITRHVCTESEKSYYEVESSEFFWKEDNNLKIFESEELRSFPSPADDFFHCRYMHSIYNLTNNDFVHFDGAIRSYDANSMAERNSKSFLQFGKKAIYKKLFRIDGKLPLHNWKSLITHYYQGNPLIYEYFGLKEEREAFKVEPETTSRLEELLPFDIKKEEGLRILVSYHPLPDDFREGRYVDIPDVMGSGEERFHCIEKRVHEIKKVLQSLGHDLEIPADWTMIKFDDRYWNIPSIMHAGDDVAEKLAITIKAMLMLFTDIVSKKIDVDISLSLAFEMNGRIVRISSFGHIQNQIEWLQNNLVFEHNEEALTKWVEDQREYLNKFQRNTESPALGSIVQMDGVLFLKRIPVTFDYDLDSTEQGMVFTISFPGNDESLELYNSNQIKPVLCVKVNKAVWTDTGEDYYTSKRNRIESNSSVTISDWEALALYWTKGDIQPIT